MHISERGLNLIKQFEGFSAKAYKCPAGVWTIGYGHTKNVKPDDLITQYQASELLRFDVLSSEGVINRLVTKTLNQAQFDACVSFVFNVGSGNFQKSTLLKKINAGDYIGAANEFPKWVYANKKKFAGLVKRRQAEKDLFLSNY